MQALAAQMQALRTSQNGIVDPKMYEEQANRVKVLTDTFKAGVRAQGDYALQNVKVISQSEILTEKLMRQRLGVRDLISSHKSLSAVYKEQIALQNMMVMQTRGADGSMSTHAIIPKNLTSDMTSARKQIGFYNEALSQAANSTVKWGKNTQWAGRQLTAGLSMPILAAGAAAGALGYQLDKSLGAVVKVYGDAADQVKISASQIRDESISTAKAAASAYGQSAKQTLDINAQLAASGMKGQQLQQATLAVSRASLLGELDRQKAIDASITLQSVYGMNTKELADAFNYMNSMENSTVLTMSDFTEAIPKVSGVLKALGGDITDTGTLLLAMKTAGIDANEGATALKSISFHAIGANAAAMKMFKDNTGKNLDDIIKKTNADIIPTLTLMGNAMKGLDEQSRVNLISKIFGIHQGSKALSLIEQLTTGSAQMTQGLKVAGQTTEEWATTANGELESLQNTISNKVLRAWESMKIEVQQTGMAFLPAALGVLNVATAIIKGFKGLGDGQKKFLTWALVFTAIAGPLVMLAGLFANLAGNVVKFGTFFAGLAFKFKLVTAETRAGVLLQDMMSKSMTDEARSAEILQGRLNELTRALSRYNDEITVAQKEKAIASLPQPTVMQHPRTGSNVVEYQPNRYRPAGKNEIAESKARQDAIDAIKNASPAANSIAASSATTARNWSATTRAVGGLGFGVSAMAAMVTDSGSIVNTLGNLGTVLIPLGSMIAELKTVQALAGGVAGRLGSVGKVISTSRAGSAVSGIVKSLVGVAPMIGLGFGAVAAGAGLLYLQIHKSMEKTRQEQEKINNSAKDWGDILGYAYSKAGAFTTAAQKQQMVLQTYADKMRESNKTNYDQIANSAGKDATVISPAEMQRAVQEGLKVRNGGGTAQQAEQAAATVLKIMQKQFSEDELIAQVHMAVDFNDAKSVAQETGKNLTNVMTAAADNEMKQGRSESFARIFTGNDDLNTGGGEAIKGAVQQMYSVYRNTAISERRKAFDEMIKSMTADIDKSYNLLKDRFSNSLGKMNITNADQFRTALQDDPQKIYRMKDNTGQNILSPNERRQLQRESDALQASVQELGKQAGLTDDKLKELKMSGLENALGANEGVRRGIKSRTDAAKSYNEALAINNKGNKKWSESEKLAVLNVWRHAAGLDDAKKSQQGFNDKLDDGTVALDQNSDAAKKAAKQIDQFKFPDLKTATSDQLVSGMKDAYSSAMNDIYSEAERIADQSNERTMQGIAKRYTAMQDSIEAKNTAWQDRYDKKRESFDSRWDAAQERLKKNQENRSNAIEKTYDNRVKGIQNQIDKEQEAENVRQKIFDAEKTRMSRLADMTSKRITLEQALNSGSLDEAARISNDMTATQTDWYAGDAAASSQSASEKRIAALQAESTAVGVQKDARLKAIKNVEDAENKAADKRKKREQAALEAEKKRWDRSVELQKSANDKNQKAAEDAARKTYEANKRAIDQSLLTLKASVPRTKVEYNAQIRAIEKAYGSYGIRLKQAGTGWAVTVGTALSNQTNKAAASMKNDIQWAAVGEAAAKQMTAGAFGMDLNKFMQWISTGKLPEGYDPAKAKAAVDPNRIPVGPRKGKYVPIDGSMHTGGIVGQSAGGRTGFSGKQQSQSEVTINALKGESVLNRKATRNLGSDFINKVNKGEPMDGMGDGVHTGAVGLMGSVVAGFVAGIKGAMMNAMMGAAQARMMQDAAASYGSLDFTTIAPKAGKFGNTQFGPDQLQNAGTIASVGKSLGASSRDIIIALMTSMQESGLKNINYGDRDSLGLFQQRNGWGSAADRTNPSEAAKMFFLGGHQGQRGLLDFKNRDAMALTEAAQAVQVSAFPSAYAKWEDEARAIFQGMQINKSATAGMAIPGGAAAPVTSGGWQRPIPGRVNSNYGWRIHPITGTRRFHDGVDIAAPGGTPIRSMLSGMVTQAGWSNGGFGNYTTVQSGDLTLGYGHQSRIGVNRGQTVTKGQIIGNVGTTGASTGNHLHLLTHRNGERVNPQSVFPGLREGGFTLSDGYAKLHKSEAVLTAPLTNQLTEGIKNIDQSANSTISLQNLNVTFTGPVNSEIDFQRGVEKALTRVEARKGVKRKVG